MHLYHHPPLYLLPYPLLHCLQLGLLRLELLFLLVQSLMQLLVEGMDVSVDHLLNLLRPSRHIPSHRGQGTKNHYKGPHAIDATLVGTTNYLWPYQFLINRWHPVAVPSWDAYCVCWDLASSSLCMCLALQLIETNIGYIYIYVCVCVCVCVCKN